VISTVYGDTIEILREQAVPEPASPNPGSPKVTPKVKGMPLPAGPAPPPASASTASASAGQPPRPAPPLLRTHALVFRPPLEPEVALRRLSAPDASFARQRRGLVQPLLAPAEGAGGPPGKASREAGEVSLLIAADTSEMLVASDRITSIPSFETRFSYGDGFGGGGLRLPGGHALILGEMRRRLTLEEHGANPPRPPLYLGAERESGRRRSLTLGRRDDGTVGVLVFDGSSPETVGVAEIDRMGAGVLGIRKLAPWSSVITADDPRCRAERDAYRALVLLDPTAWFEVDPALLPGVTFARQGMALVRWGKERVCLEGIDAAAVETRRKADGARSWSLVVRWRSRERAGAPAVNGALRAPDLRQALRCATWFRPAGP
jgi:hypothetical protein